MQVDTHPSFDSACAGGRILRILLILFTLFPCSGLAQELQPREMHLFSGRSCGSCAPLEAALQKENVSYSYHNIDELIGYKLLSDYEKDLRREATTLPVLIYGNTMICGREEILKAIPAAALWQRSGVISSTAAASPASQDALPEAAVAGRVQRLGFVPIALAGLVDGINPCAFATIAFLIGCLLGSGRRRALITGLGFAAGVFAAYFLAGLGAFRLLFALREFATLRQWFHYAALLLLALFTLLALADALWLKVKGGKPLLRMPENIRLRANALIARKVRNGGFLFGGFVLGCLISLLELACTGQLYLPTILYLIESGTAGATPYLYLLLYNVMFILPLLAVLLLCLRGLAVKRLWELLQTKAWLSRLALAGVLLLMLAALYMK